MKTELVRGGVVRSMAGHDQGGLFVILDTIDDDFVLIADGRTRTLAKPKKKKRKHLKAIPAFRMETITNAQLLDADVRKFLKACGENQR